MLELLESSAPFDRGRFEPGHFTASAFVQSEDRTSLLLIHHGKLGIWVQPGGHVDAEDALVESAAAREVAEETGLVGLAAAPGPRPIFDVDVHSIPERKGEPAHEHFDVRFHFVAASTTLSVSAEVRDARWVPLERVAAFTSDESVLRAVRKLR